jgi:hypothetical protein
LGDARFGSKLKIVGANDRSNFQRRYVRRRWWWWWFSDVLFIVLARFVLLLGGEARLALDVLSYPNALPFAEQ